MSAVQAHGCDWFALCPNPADGVVEHPVLGWVLACLRCADKFGLDLVLAEVLEGDGE